MQFKEGNQRGGLERLIWGFLTFSNRTHPCFRLEVLAYDDASLEKMKTKKFEKRHVSHCLDQVIV